VSRKKRDFKNFALAFLLIAAIYQTGTLWLENYSGHNFFYYMSALGKSNVGENITSEALDAEYITVGYGNKMFGVLYGEKGNEIKKCADEVIKQAVDKSIIEGSEEIVLSEILDKKSVVFSMPFESLVSDYINALDADATGQNVYDYTFDSIVVIPAEGVNEENTAYFVNSASNTAVVAGGVFDDGQKLLTLIDETEETYIYDLQYISTAQSGFNIFSKNIFVPQWTQSSFEYIPVTEKTIFDMSDESDFITKLEPFFGRYYGQSVDMKTSGEFTISDDEVVVKYTDKKILEYYSYKTEDESVTQNTYSAYEACREFLNNDETLKTDYYLSQIQIKNNAISFSFDYCIDNMPIVLTEETEEGKVRTHAMEVVVKNNAVKNYRRYAVNFEKSGEDNMNAENDFLMAVNDAATFAGDGGQLTAIDDMVLGYGLGKNGLYSLKWFTEFEGKVYVTDTEGAE